MARPSRIAALLATAAGVLLIAPALASATVTCAHTENGLADVVVSGDEPLVSIQRDGNDIVIREGSTTGGPIVTCAPDEPTVTTTTQVVVSDTDPANELRLIVSLQGGPLEPGTGGTPENAGVGEVEVTFAGNGGTDRLDVEGSDLADKFRFGSVPGPGVLLANLNDGRETAGRDIDDIATTDVEELVAQGRQGDDQLNAAGDAGAFPAADAADPERLVLEGNNNDDFLRGGSGADSLQGGSQADNVIGGAGDDVLDGGDHNDRLEGGGDADTLEGGGGTDRADYGDRSTSLTITIGNGVADDGGSQDASPAGRDNVTPGTENIDGGAAPDSITGSFLANVLRGNAGNDVVLGAVGNDRLYGDLGSDSVSGGTGNDQLFGGGEFDVLTGDSGSDKLFGGDAADRLFGGGAGDFLKGGRGKDTFKGQGGNDRLSARDGKRDKRIDCGKGNNRKESAKADKRDPKPRSC